MVFLKKALAWLPLLLLSMALYFAHREFAQFSFSELRDEIADWPSYSIGLAAFLTVLNFTVLSLYDRIGLRHMGFRLKGFTVFRTAFYSFSVSNLVGHSLLSGASMRMRTYLREGLTPLQVTQISTQNTLGFWLGFLSLGALSLAVFPQDTELLSLSQGWDRVVATLFVAIVVFGLIASAIWSARELRIGSRFALTLPKFGGTLQYLGISVIDLIVCAAVLFSLLPPASQIGFWHFLGIFMIAQSAGILSGVPGGLGVFDAVLLKLLGPYHEPHEIISSLALFRIIYYLVPFVVTICANVWEEFHSRRERIVSTVKGIHRIAGPLIVRLLALATIFSGIVLLFSGVLPALHDRIMILSNTLPLFVIEFSHLAGSLTGLLLILISGELWQRNRRALQLVQVLLGVGIVASLLKGLDYEEAGILSLILLLTFLSRDAFRKKSKFEFRGLSFLQLGSVFCLLLACTYAGFVVYQKVPYHDSIWLRFRFVRGDAARFLRSIVLLAVATVFFAAYSFLKSKGHRSKIHVSIEDLASVEEILKGVTETDARLALIGDKNIMFSVNRKAFLMYGVRGSSWIALGDVYGDPSARLEVMKRFVTEAEDHAGRALFYQLGEVSLATALDLGLQIYKIGEEAHINLAEFSLEGNDKRGMRATKNKSEREGLVFRVVPREAVGATLGRLREISDAWLLEKRADEKGFSLGVFREDYVSHFPCAVIEREGKILAFANLWLGSQTELSLDLMRYDPAAPHKGLMDFLFVNVLVWGRENGFREFNFGMAPLSGLQSQPWSPLWYKMGHFIYRHGEQFYNFQGLREYKSKYQPRWKMRFIATPAGVSLVGALIDVALLIGGGWRGILGLRKAKT